MTAPEAWRRTGRKAGADHLVGLVSGELVEMVVYDNGGRTQGTLVVELVHRDMASQGEGETWLCHAHAVSDEYFDWWMSQTYDSKKVGVHFCLRRGDQCRVRTHYRDPLHADVFRLLPQDAVLGLPWLSMEEKAHLTQWLKASRAPEPEPAQVVGDGGGDRGDPGLVATGAAGVRGLAEALGSGGGKRPPVGGEEEEPAEEAPPKKKKVAAEDDASRDRYGEALQEELAGRKAPRQGASALRLTAKKKKKKGKKKKKAKKKDDKSSSSSSDGTSDSLFRLAALPTGTEKIHRLHEEKPGALANLALMKFREILERTVGLGRGTAEEDTSLPPVCRGYLTQILLGRYPEEVMGVRNLRELRTLPSWWTQSVRTTV